MCIYIYIYMHTCVIYVCIYIYVYLWPRHPRERSFAAGSLPEDISAAASCCSFFLADHPR